MGTPPNILKLLLKDLTARPTITYLAKETTMTRVGVWKALKRLEKENFITLTPVGSGKTSTCSVGLNWGSPLVEKTLAVALTEDALKNQRWRSNFAGLEGTVDFLILYGSVIHSPKEANDIDILGVVSRKDNFKEIDKTIAQIQKTQIKKIHAINFTQKELKQEIEKPNKAFVDAIKKGVVLFGQERFIKFIKGVVRK